MNKQIIEGEGLSKSDTPFFGVYVRVSSDDQNINQQLNILKDYCIKNNIQYRSYRDFGISGEISDRPAWQKLIKDLSTNKMQGILVIKWDRITRNLKYAIEFLEFYDKQDFKLLSVYDGVFDGSPDNKFNFKLQCLLSERELDILRWRSKIGIERAKLEGKYKGRPKGSKNIIK